MLQLTLKTWGTLHWVSFQVVRVLHVIHCFRYHILLENGRNPVGRFHAWGGNRQLRPEWGRLASQACGTAPAPVVPWGLWRPVSVHFSPEMASQGRQGLLPPTLVPSIYKIKLADGSFPRLTKFFIPYMATKTMGPVQWWRTTG